MKDFIKGIRAVSLFIISFGFYQTYGFSFITLESISATEDRSLLGFVYDKNHKQAVFQFLFMNLKTKGYA